MKASRTAPVLSVVMAVRDGESYVSQAIRSILCQTFEDFEFIIVDDGSVDRTPRILDRFASCDDRIKVITQENAGLTVSLNRAIRRARGTYIARQDADDLSMACRLEVQLSFMTRKNLEFAASDYFIFDDAGCYYERRPSERKHLVLRSLLIGNQLAHNTYIFRNSGDLLYDETFERAQDFELWLRILKQGIPWGVVPTVLAGIRKHAMNVSFRSEGGQARYGLLAIRKHYRGAYPLARLCRKVMKNVQGLRSRAGGTTVVHEKSSERS